MWACPCRWTGNKTAEQPLKEGTWSLHLDLQGHGTAGLLFKTSAEVQLPVIVVLYFSLETRGRLHLPFSLTLKLKQLFSSEY